MSRIHRRPEAHVTAQLKEIEVDVALFRIEMH